MAYKEVVIPQSIWPGRENGGKLPNMGQNRIDHPAVDRLAAALDPCPVVFGGTTLGNVLTINDVEIANTP